MEEEQDPSPNYIVGFNQGYLMAENMPDLLKSILSTPNNESERIKGMKAGQQHFELQKMKDQVRLAKEQQMNKGRSR